MNKNIILLYLLIAFGFNQVDQKVGVLTYIEGSCIVNNSRLDSRQSNLVYGSSLFNDDSIIYSDNSECHITYDDGLTYVILTGNSKIILFEDNFSRTIKLSFGKILAESSKGLIKTYISTPSNEIYINNNKVWIESCGFRYKGIFCCFKYFFLNLLSLLIN